MNRTITVIWTALLIVTGVVVVPAVLSLLQRALNAARNIDQYTTEILASGVETANHTANVTALQSTITVAQQLIAGAESIARHTATIATALTPRGPADSSGAQR